MTTKGINSGRLLLAEDDTLREAFVAMGRNCKRLPKALSNTRHTQTSPYRAVRRMAHQAILAGADIVDVVAFFKEMIRDARRVAGIEAPRCVRESIKASIRVSAVANTLEAELLDPTPTLSEVLDFIAKKEAESLAVEAEIEAACQLRDEMIRNQRRVA